MDMYGKHGGASDFRQNPTSTKHHQKNIVKGESNFPTGVDPIMT